MVKPACIRYSNGCLRVLPPWKNASKGIYTARGYPTTCRFYYICRLL